MNVFTLNINGFKYNNIINISYYYIYTYFYSMFFTYIIRNKFLLFYNSSYVTKVCIYLLIFKIKIFLKIKPFM